jgi:murein DD-endopeptidase MepM/ murein hydrolase activator NlpD
MLNRSKAMPMNTPNNIKNQSLLTNPNFQGIVILLVVLGVGGFLLLENTQPKHNYASPNSSQLGVTEDEWQSALQNQLENPATAKPTLTLPPTLDIPMPVIPTVADSALVFMPPQVIATDLPSPTPISLADLALTPTFPVIGSTPVPSPTGIDSAQLGYPDNSQIEGFAPPAEQDPPLSRQPFDHFLFRRPVNANANGASLFYYPYGSTGQVGRIHHGIDLPNPIGEILVAANSGTVVWAGQSLTDEVINNEFEVFASYGNFIVIQHDFSWEGQNIYTLYAHLEAILVSKGEQVTLGEPIGLIGDTGWSTGPHVHFEVRVGINNYSNTRNPLLWIVPYLGHGVVAGRVIDTEGLFVDDMVIQLYRGGRQVDTTRTYMKPKQAGQRLTGVVVDENWQENFVLGDVPEGQYELVALIGEERITQTIYVLPGMVNFFEFEVNPPPSTPIAIINDEGY